MEEFRPDIKIDGSVATWELNTVGSIMGTYIGSFRFRCFLTPLQQIAAGKEERELLGSGLSLAPDHERFLAYALTQLRYRIISAPPFWLTGNAGNLQGDIPDESVISTILSAAIDGEKKYKDEIKERKEEAIMRAKKAHENIIKVELQDRLDNELVEKS